MAEQRTTGQLVDSITEQLDNDECAALLAMLASAERELLVQVDSQLVNLHISEIDRKLTDQVNEILHDEKFQKLESAWRGVAHLVQNTDFSVPISIGILDAPKEEIYEDLDAAAKGEGYDKESGLFHHVYWDAYDMVGGHPYTVLVTDFDIDRGPTDIQLLRHLAVLGESAQLPILGNVSPKFFGHASMEEVMTDRLLTESVNTGAEYTAWRSFREEDGAKYIGLCLPRFIGRLRYSPDSDKVNTFMFEEHTYHEGKDRSLYVHASFALAANMVRCFEKSGWTTNIVGVDSGGRVEGLPLSTYSVAGQTILKVPVEASVGMAKDQELSLLGFISLAHWDRTDYACFFEVPSVQRAIQDKKNLEASGDATVAARLQFQMLVTRIAHYLRYQQLRFVGRHGGKAEVKKSLEDWLKTLVSDQPNPTEEVMAKRPLRRFNISVTELRERPGFFQIEAEFTPHVAVVGMDINLRLKAMYSGEEE